MALTAEQQELAIKWIREKLSMRSCPSCGQLKGFALGEILALPIVKVSGEGITVDMDNSVPAVPLVCHNCGDIRFFSALAMRLIPESQRINVKMDGGSYS
jgi:hypothetical protein